MRCANWIAGILALGGTLMGCQPSKPPAKAGDNATATAGLNREDQLLLAAAKVALPPLGVAAGDLPEPASRGALLVAQYCGQCHALPTPSAHSATDWPSVARRMWLRMEWLSPSLGVQVPPPAERGTILSYLLANSLKVSGAMLPPGQGRDEFAVVCSQCHGLPDPRTHSADDWPAVYSRMERNMERMQVQPPGGTVSTDILLYLQTVAGKRPPARD
jgi:mono/diheme cytochrome c family protein